MSVYDGYPKGMYLVGSHKVEKNLLMEGIDFVVAHLGTGMKRTANFTDHIQTAADAGLPLVAYYENDPESFVAQYQTLNLDHWLKTPLANWLVKDVLVPSLFSGGVLRTVHGVIIGMNKLVETSGKTIPDVWVIDTARFLKRVIQDMWGLPVFFYIDPVQAGKLPHGPDDQFTTFLGGKDSNGNYNLPGISTYFNAFGGGVVEAGWGRIPAPDDGMTDAFRKVKMESGLGNARQIEFLCYSTGKFTFPGVSGNTVPLWLYFGSRASLYDRLRFTPPQTGPGQPGEQPGEPQQPGGDLSLLWGALYQGLDAFAAAWLKGRGRIGGG